MNLLIPVCVVCASITSVKAQQYAELMNFFGTSKYSVLSERTYEFKNNGTWGKRPESAGTDKMVSEYSKNQNTEGMRSIRYFGKDKVDYIHHAVWDGKSLKFLRTLNDTASLIIEDSIELLDQPNRSANFVTLPWVFLGVSSEEDLGRGRPIPFTEEINKRMLSLLPFIKKNDFFELPYAPGILCKVNLTEDGGVQSFILKTKDEVLVWTLGATETKRFTREGGYTVSIPTVITDTFEVKNEIPAMRTYKLLDLKFDGQADSSILQIDASKAGFLYDKNSHEYLKIK